MVNRIGSSYIDSKCGSLNLGDGGASKISMEKFFPNILLISCFSMIKVKVNSQLWCLI